MEGARGNGHMSICHAGTCMTGCRNALHTLHVQSRVQVNTLGSGSLLHSTHDICWNYISCEALWIALLPEMLSIAAGTGDSGCTVDRIYDARAAFCFSVDRVRLFPAYCASSTFLPEASPAIWAPVRNPILRPVLEPTASLRAEIGLLC